MNDAEERLALVRHYVEGNRDVWSDDPTDRLGMAYADIYQKVLNVIDTGHPMREAAGPPSEMGEPPEVSDE